MYECNNSSGEVNLQGLLFEASTATFSIKSSHDLLSNITSVHLIKRSTLMYECNNSSGEVNLQGLLFEASTATFSIKSSHDLLSNIASVHLIKRSTLMYECNNSSGEVNLQGLLFEASTATFSVKSSHDMVVAIQDVDLTLDTSQTGLTFGSLQLKLLTIDNITTTDLSSKSFSHNTNPTYDLLFTSDSINQSEVMITNSWIDRRDSTGLMINVTTVSEDCLFMFTVSNTRVSNHIHGGIVIEQTSKSIGKLHFHLVNSIIEHNQLGLTDYNLFAAGLSVHCETSNTTHILINDTKFIKNQDRRSQPVTVYITRANKVTIEDSDFINNTGTAIQINNVNDECMDEKFSVKGTVNFVGNHAHQGGALSLISAVMSIRPYTNLTFENNQATDVGGAVFVDSNIPYYDQIDPDTLVSCFYRFPKWENTPQNCYSITFSNNGAENGGSDIYGASLHCYCTVFNGEKRDKIMRSNDKEVLHLFHFNGDRHRSSMSSNPSRVCLIDKDTESSISDACTDQSRIFDYSVQVYPGEMFRLDVVIVGAEFGTGVGQVYAQFLNESTEMWPKYNESQKVDKPDKSHLYYTVSSNLNDTEVMLVLTTTNRGSSNLNRDDHTRDVIHKDIEKYKSKGVISTGLLTTPIYINVKLNQSCPPGFGMRKCTDDDCQQQLYGCRCNKALKDKQIQCFIDNGVGFLNIREKVWIGIPENGSSGCILFYENCPFDYCEIKNDSINIEENPDKQCVKSRMGTLCGKCIKDTSLAIGSNECIECNNNHLALLIFFAAAGILLVLFISILNMTVSQGTINGLIFYANVMWAYESIFFPRVVNETFPTHMLRAFLAWLNLDFGIKTCFVEGLDAYAKTWLQFVFPLYTWIIVGAIILLTKCSSRVASLLGENRIPVLATIILLSYGKILRAIVIALQPANLKVVDEHGSINRLITVWAYDGNLEYWGKEHTLLFVFSLLILIFLWLPYTLVLLCIQPLRSASRYRCLRWVNHMYIKPFLDAYVGPLRSQNHFWVGLLLLVRCILFIIVAATYPNHPQASELTLVIVITLLFLLLYHTRHLYSKPKGRARYRCYHQKFLPIGISFLTILEVSFLLNLLVLGVVRLYADFTDMNDGDAKKEASVIFTSVGIAFVQFIGIVLYHLKKKLAPSQQRDYEDLDHNENKVTPKVTSTSIDPPSDDGYRDSILDETDSENDTHSGEEKSQSPDGTASNKKNS